MGIKLIPLKCPVCGGTVNYETLICEYCGTHFVLSDSQFARLPRYTLTSSKKYDEFEAGIHREIILDHACEETLRNYEGISKENEAVLIEIEGNYIWLDDQVDRKIIRYLKESLKRKHQAEWAKFNEFVREHRKLKRAFQSGQIDEDAYYNSREKLKSSYPILTRKLDCGEALIKIKEFIEGIAHWGPRYKEEYKLTKESQKGFKNIKEVKRIIFYLVDGKVYEDSFVYKIAGFVDCITKSGIFSTKPSRKYFSAEVDCENGKICSFIWEQRESLNTQEYLKRPLALPRFL